MPGRLALIALLAWKAHRWLFAHGPFAVVLAGGPLIALIDNLWFVPAFLYVIAMLHLSGFDWVQFALATPVVLWGGWPFFVRGWQSIVNRSLNMFTLIGLGTGVAYTYSLVATMVPAISTAPSVNTPGISAVSPPSSRCARSWAS